MMSFLPALAPALLGEELQLPNVATWWLGDPAARAHAIDQLDELVFSPAFSGEAPPHIPQGQIVGRDLRGEARARMLQAIERRGVDFVAQEAVTLSTTPVWENGQLSPRPFSLRIHLTRVGDGWEVMPGGFVRIASELDARAITLQQGARTADAWVLSDRPVPQTTLLPSPGHVSINRGNGALPSRVASNLFWLGRYVERTEATLRLVRVFVSQVPAEGYLSHDLYGRVIDLLEAWDAVPEDMLNLRPAMVASAVLQQHRLTGALPYLAGAAMASASVIRDRFSPDAWRAVTELVNLINAPFDQNPPTESVILERLNDGLRILASFSGLAQENMNRLLGWRFLDLGRRIERALATCAFLRQFACGEGTDSTLDAMLELADSQITYRLRYVMVAAAAPVVDLVALDPSNPRSVLHQLTAIDGHLTAMPNRGRGANGEADSEASAMLAAWRAIDVSALRAHTLLDLESDLMALSDKVAAAYFTTRRRSELAPDAQG